MLFYSCLRLFKALFFNVPNKCGFFSSSPSQTRRNTFSSGDRDRMKLNISLVGCVLHHVASVVIICLSFTFRDSA